MSPQPKDTNAQLQEDLPQPPQDSVDDSMCTPRRKDTVASSSSSDSTDEEDDSIMSSTCASRCRLFPSQCLSFYRTNEFLILVVVAILLARAYPPLGAEYLHPEITSTWMAVCLIFVMAGLGLKTEEFSKAFQAIWFNLFVQLYNFGVVSATVYGVSRALAALNILSIDLANGMLVASCLPMTMNMVLVLTKSAGGDEGLAVVNSAVSNLSGVFLSPLLILGYLGASGDVDLVEVFYKLAARVMLPLLVGQILQKCVPKIHRFYTKHRQFFKKVQEYTVVYIVYTTFCRTFANESSTDSTIGDIFLCMIFVFICLTSLMAASWYTTGVFWNSQPKLRVMALFGCTQKTIGIGLPLINAIYESHPSVGLYTLPLLMWHPMQLVIGSFLAPRLAAFVERVEAEQLEVEVAASLSIDEPDNGDVVDDDDIDLEHGEPNKRIHHLNGTDGGSSKESPTADESDTMDESEESEISQASFQEVEVVHG